MKKILTILSSPGGAASFSTQLSYAIVEKLLSDFPGSSVHTYDLTHKSFPHLESDQIASFFTPPEYRTEDNKTSIVHSDKVISELMDADIVVIGVPMHNFSVPSTLKAWIDHVVRVGVTFRFTETGSAEGLLQNKKVYLAIATGNIYSTGDFMNYDFTESYLKSILGFIGITDVVAYRVEGTAILGVKELALQKAIDGIAA